MLVRRQLRYRYQPPRRYPPKYLTVPPLHHHRSLARLLRCRSAALIATSPIGGRPTFRVTELGFVTAGDFVTDFVTTLTGFVTGFATARTNRAITCSPVAFNDIKHLTRPMLADGIEAQDVVPPRCGCWVAHEPAIPT